MDGSLGGHPKTDRKIGRSGGNNVKKKKVWSVSIGVKGVYKVPCFKCPIGKGGGVRNNGGKKAERERRTTGMHGPWGVGKEGQKKGKNETGQSLDAKISTG